jgi:hypothetical protein
MSDLSNEMPSLEGLDSYERDALSAVSAHEQEMREDLLESFQQDGNIFEDLKKARELGDSAEVSRLLHMLHHMLQATGDVWGLKEYSSTWPMAFRGVTSATVALRDNDD